MEAGGEADMRRLWQLPDTGKGVITGEGERERDISYKCPLPNTVLYH